MAVLEQILPASGSHRLPWWLKSVPPSAAVAASLPLAICLLALLVPLLHLPDPTTGSLSQRLLPPGSAGHPLGTDGQGRDPVGDHHPCFDGGASGDDGRPAEMFEPPLRSQFR